MNRGVEIDSAVADGPGSAIIDQVRSGLVVRMAVLYDLLNGPSHSPAESALRIVEDAAPPPRSRRWHDRRAPVSRRPRAGRPGDLGRTAGRSRLRAWTATPSICGSRTA